MLPGPRGGSDLGRWPSNVLLDEIAAQMLDAQSGELTSGANLVRRGSDKFRDVFGEFKGQATCDPARGADAGGAARFFYVAKPSRSERERGCETLEMRPRDETRKEGNPGGDNPRNRGLQRRGNFHPTVKPIELMRYLVRLVTPNDGVVLDPFTGSGTTGMACVLEGVRFIGIEREADYVAIAERRIASVLPLFGSEVSA
jgi:site-specific DNA-methyltransferase (adenine-specific)